MSEPLVDVEAIAERLGVDPSWVYDRARRGIIPHIRLGRYVRFRVSDVDAWVDSIAIPGKPGGRGYDRRPNSPRAAETAEGVTTPRR